MLQETLRCLQKSEHDLGVNLEAVKALTQHAILDFDKLPNKCSRCWGRGVIKCLLCGGQGEISVPTRRNCSRCLASCLEQCPDCCGYGIV